MDQNQIIEAIKGMTILELADLVKAIEEEFGVKMCIRDRMMLPLRWRHTLAGRLWEVLPALCMSMTKLQ